MSKQEWKDKTPTIWEGDVLEHFYSLYLEEIKAIREQIVARKKDFTDHICRFNDTPQKCECYEKALDDVLLTISRIIDRSSLKIAILISKKNI